MNVQQRAMDSSKYFENSGRIWLSRFTLTVLWFNLLSLSDSQSTTEHHLQHCNPLGNCLSTSGLLDKLTEENTHLKELINRLKADLQDQAQQLRDLRSDLDNALSRWRDMATTKATYNSLDHTTSTVSVSTKSPNPIQPIAVISITSRIHNMLLHGGRVYTLHFVNSELLYSLEIHDALNGKTIGVTYPPRTANVAHISVCRKNNQLFMATGNNGWYANVSLLESNTNITWQNLNWYTAVYGSENRIYEKSFTVSDDCERVMVGQHYSVLEIRRLSDGGLLVARNLTKTIDTIVERDQRYYITFVTSHGVIGDSYVTEYDQQLNEVRRFYESGVPSYTGVGFFVHFIAAHEDGGIFISNDGIIYVRPDFMSFVEVVPSIAANDVWYDTEQKLLAVAVGSDGIRIYNITRELL